MAPVLPFCFKGTGQDVIYRLALVPNFLLHYSATPPTDKNHHGQSFPHSDFWTIGADPNGFILPIYA